MKSKKLVSALLAVTMMGQVGVCAVPAFAAETSTQSLTVQSIFKQTAKVVLNEDVSITYNMDTSVMKQALYESLINFDESTLPEDTTVDDFTFTYGPLYTDFNGLAGLGAIGAGDTVQINVTYKGNSDYYATIIPASANVTINKASMKISMNLVNSIYCDEDVPDDMITVSPADPKINVFTIYAGVNTDLSIGAWVQMPKNLTDIVDTLDQTGLPKQIMGQSFKEMLQNGVTFGEFCDLLNELVGNDLTMTAMSLIGLDTDTIQTLLDTMNNLPSVVRDITIGFGTPNKAGLYAVVAVGLNSNYETGYGFGSLIVKMRLTGNNLTWAEDASTITEEQAQLMNLGAQLSRNGDVTISQKNVKVRYTGITDAGSLYSSTTAPTEAGKYLEYALTVGGNYFATPITRTFTITAAE